MELVPETSENLHVLTRLSAWEHFIEFCSHESQRHILPNTYKMHSFFTNSELLQRRNM
jgi:hypothetical protein